MPRAVPVDFLSSVLNSSVTVSASFGVQIDGDLIRKSSVTAPAAGRFIKVPFLLGTNFDEAIMFGTKGVNTDSEFLYRCAVCWS
jgi:triacylglycerol lipase